VWSYNFTSPRHLHSNFISFTSSYRECSICVICCDTLSSRVNIFSVFSDYKHMKMCSIRTFSYLLDQRQFCYDFQLHMSPAVQATEHQEMTHCVAVCVLYASWSHSPSCCNNLFGYLKTTQSFKISENSFSIHSYIGSNCYGSLCCAEEDSVHKWQKTDITTYLTSAKHVQLLQLVKKNKPHFKHSELCYNATE